MLLQLSVENYGRFADKAVLRLLAVPGEAHPDGQVVDVPGVGPVPNGAGKSHLVDVFAQVCHLATRLRAIRSPCALTSSPRGGRSRRDGGEL